MEEKQKEPLSYLKNTTAEVKEIIPRGEVVAMMKKRGYALVHESFDKTILNFCNINAIEPDASINEYATKFNLTYLVEKNCYTFFTFIQPGMIKLSTDYFSSIEDEEGFRSIEKYIKDVLKKIYS